MPPADLAAAAAHRQSLPVEHLFTLELDTKGLDPVVIANGPAGTRAIVPVATGRFEGKRMSGAVSPAGTADWALVRPDGSLKIDVRAVLTTDDGAAVYFTYTGIGRAVDGKMALRTAGTFETGDERYSWLNTVQTIAYGDLVEGGVRYEVYAVS